MSDLDLMGQRKAYKITGGAKGNTGNAIRSGGGTPPTQPSSSAANLARAKAQIPDVRGGGLRPKGQTVIPTN